MQINLKAPAKINIGLIVKDKRPDGYHNIDTVLVPIKLYDSILIKKANRGIQLRINTHKLGSVKNNLVYKAAELFFSQIHSLGGVEISLTKKIPVGAGLGGGSSDAAYTLLGLNRLYNNILSFQQLKLLSIKIGMDVAFFLYQRPCFTTGRGDILKPIKIPKLTVVLYLPQFSISTKWAYKQLDVSRYNKLQTTNDEYLTRGVGLTDQDFSLKLLSKRLVNNDLVGVNTLLVNTFEKVIYYRYPELLKVKTQFIANGAKLASLSGTGSTIYGIFDSTTIKKQNQRLDKKIVITETIS